MALPLEKERNKVQSKNNRDANLLQKMMEKEALKAKGSKKKAKKGEEKACEPSEAPCEPIGKSFFQPVVNLQSETLPPNPCKHDADFVGLLVSRLS